MAKADLTAQRLRELLSYNPETGVFTRKVRRANSHAGAIAGHTKASGYRVIHIDDRLYRSHRLAWLYVHGEWPKGTIDHINGNPADNSIDNLRDCSHNVNMQNLHKPKCNSKSGILGVHYAERRDRWVAQIGVGGKVLFLGHFKTSDEASAAYVAAKREHHEGCAI